MRTKYNQPSRYIWWWITLTLAATASLSAPFLIDGISYTKVSIALVMTSCLMPYILIKLFGVFSSKSILSLLSLLLFINLYLLYLNSNSYRSVFGAPGRHNGYLSAIVCSYYFLIGIYTQKFSTILDFYKSIAYVSGLTSLCILLITEFKLGVNSVFESNNFLSTNFAENTNLIAPLMCVGFVSSLVAYRKTRTPLFFVFLIPISLVAIKLHLIQIYIILCISIFILGFSCAKRHYRSAWLPVVIFIGYLLGLFLALQGVFDRDSSIKERTDILREAGKIFGEFSFLPVNIDSLSDFTGNFASFNGVQFLDDFHNVFLQTTFSFGLLIGFFFFFLSIYPFFISFLSYRDKMEFLSVYTSLFLSLLIGISSPNYIYIFFILIGYSVANLLKISEVSKLGQMANIPITWVLVSLLLVTPIYVQIKDLNIRFKISDTAIKAKAQNMFTDPNFKTLVILLSKLDDAGYRTRMALNFYSISECKYGDLVYEMMAKTNPDEARLRGLDPAKRGCVEA